MTCPSVTTDPGVSDDRFLDGRLRFLQPRAGFRAATDSVLLAAAVPARPGQSVLELGCGVGVASLCLSARVPGLELAGVELQAPEADLARRNAARNGVALDVATADLAALPAALRARRFDHVIANPPYDPSGAGTAARACGRERARREVTPLGLWIDVALRRLKDRGWLTVIHRADRLPDLLVAIAGRGGDIAVRPVAAREGRPAGRVLLCARKGARGPFRLLAPLVLHAGAAHDADRDSYTCAARAILRDAAPVAMQD